jgi:ABC-type branched-subunit amino acid transport system substrate-binding protein
VAAVVSAQPALSLAHRARSPTGHRRGERADTAAVAQPGERVHARPLSGIGLALCCLLLLSGCGRSFEDAAAARTAYAARAEGSIVVAVVDEPTMPGYLDGVRLAVDEINAARGGLLGRPLAVRVFPGSANFDRARPTVRRIADDPRISAVLGHRLSSVAIPASVVYDTAQVLFMPPYSTREQLTLHGFEFVLRMLPDNTAMARQSASLARLFGYRRIAILHADDDYARELAFLFEDAARGEGIEIVFRGSFFKEEANYRGLLAQLAGIDFDAVYLSTDTAPGARVLAQMRELGLHSPVIGSDVLNFGPLAETVGAAGERTMVPVMYDIDDPSPRNVRFIAAFTEQYGRPPNQNAAQGYDSLGLLAHIIGRAGSTAPKVLTTTAHFGPPWAGLTGIYAFDPRGNLFGKRYRFQVLRFGRWWALPGVTIPYVLSSFRELHTEREMAEAAAEAASEQAGAETMAATTTETAAAPEEGAMQATDSPPEAPSLPETASMAEAEPTPAVEANQATTNQARANQARANQAAAATEEETDAFALEALSARRIQRSRRNQIWLALMQELLEFQRLGLVVPANETGDAMISLARTVGAARDFEIDSCRLAGREEEAAEMPTDAAPPPGGPTASVEPVEAAPVDPGATAPAADEATSETADASPATGPAALERAAVACWSNFAKAVDAVLMPGDLEIDAALVRRLNRVLRDYGIPSFTLADELNVDLGLTIALVSSDIDLEEPGVALRFNGLLQGLRIGDLNRMLINLPTLSADLEALEELGIRPKLDELVLISSALNQRPDLDPGPASGPEAGPGPDPGNDTGPATSAPADAATESP